MAPTSVLPGDWQGQAQMAQISLLAAYRAGRDLVLTRDIGFQKPKIAGLALKSPVHLGKNLPPSFVQPLTDLDQNHCSKGPSWLPDGSSTRSRLQRFATIQSREFTAANNWFWVLELGNKLFQPLPGESTACLHSHAIFPSPCWKL